MKPIAIFDTETYRDYFLASFLDPATGIVTEIEAHPDQALDVDALKAAMRGRTLVGFNSANFDLPLIAVALAHHEVRTEIRDFDGRCVDVVQVSPVYERIHKAAQAIIKQGYKSWQFEQAWGLKLPRVDHIDLIEVAPGIASLKIYGGRLHCKRMQDLPIHHEQNISPADRARLREYCINDLVTTDTLYSKLLPQLELREKMSAEYDIDLRSKSDAQIAEAVLAHEVVKLVGKPIVRQAIESGTAYRYRAPRFVQFRSLKLCDKLAEIEASEFIVQDNGSVAEPAALADKSVTIGAGVYRLGIGGLHSSETCQAVEADDEHVLVDRDVASYYPSIILRLGLAPRAMGPAFLTAYRAIVERRLKAKAAGEKVAADALKITINGSFGKLGSKWSKLYSPDLLIQTTVTGQLCLLMLIEDLEAEGITVASANTDGIVIRCHRSKLDAMGQIVTRWEQRTGFDTEETDYRALYSRDVNNYIAIKPDGKVKLKGAYATATLAKNPVNEIAIEAAVRWLRDGSPVESTVRECADIRKFVTVRSVKGGAIDQGGQYLGKAVRWYYARGVEGCLRYQVNGYTVPRSDGARPLMELPDQLPGDVDYGWYESEALSILSDVGAAGALI